jgi:hypothetical protein
MTSRHILTLAAGLLLAITTACDPSKPELEKTKQELQTVTAERDSLKSQLEQANAKNTQLTAQVAELQAKAAAAAAAPAAPAAAEPAAAKKPAGKAGKAKPLNTEQKKEIEANPEAKSGRGHF